MNSEYAIGRTRSGDQLHLCSGKTTYDNGRVTFSDNAHCNNHSHLRVFAEPKKREIKMCPGLFCKKCFGTDETRIVERTYGNAIVTK